MAEIESRCIKKVGAFHCRYCKSIPIKYGKSKTGKQRYHCRKCNKAFIEDYDYRAYIEGLKNWIIHLTKEGCGIRSVGRLLKISCNTVQKSILHCSKSIKKPYIALDQSYEVDELCTYVGNKNNRVWIAYSYCQKNKSVVDFVIGTRSKTTLQPLIEKLLNSIPTKIYTDKHQTYSALIPINIHSTVHRGTNHIERKNLTLRTHLKRLNRRTICFSRSTAMLKACLMLYFFG